MGYYYRFYGSIPSWDISDRAAIRKILLKRQEKDRCDYIHNIFIIDEHDSDLLVSTDDTKDSHNYMEEILADIAPYIKGEHKIEKTGEDQGDVSDLIIRDGKLYVVSYHLVPGKEELYFDA